MSKSNIEQEIEQLKKDYDPVFITEGHKLELSEQAYIAMKKNKLTYTDLAKQLKTSESNIVNFFAGEHHYNLLFLVQLAKILKLKLDISFKE